MIIDSYSRLQPFFGELFPPFVDFFPNFHLWPVPSLMLIGCAMGGSLRFLAQFSLLFGRTNLKALLLSNFRNILELSWVTYLYMVLIADVLLRVLLIIQQLLQESRHGSKRDIYYMHPAVFKEPSVVDRAINDICILLQCSRHNLNVVSVGNGCAYPIPVHVEEVDVWQEEPLHCDNNMRLLFCEFPRIFGSIISFFNQGRGYPDVPTRRFLRLLVDKLHLPVYCLVDCDPYGFDILTTYKFGSLVRIIHCGVIMM
uniref:DNA topoisomerase (ATP-hydrolyzing) n=1 Tax=Nicotiana tabacum TaxID=4097 RepID=A0A1S4ARH4_TOBAC|nr:PREDICTED: meiotic recombination protein SPO11-1-like [Nicotiana tabacum]